MMYIYLSIFLSFFLSSFFLSFFLSFLSICLSICTIIYSMQHCHNCRSKIIYNFWAIVTKFARWRSFQSSRLPGWKTTARHRSGGRSKVLLPMSKKEKGGGSPAEVGCLTELWRTNCVFHSFWVKKHEQTSVAGDVDLKKQIAAVNGWSHHR